MCLDYCLKTPLSQDPSTTNMLNRPKHSWEQNGSTFTIFTSILFLIETIYSNISRSNYLRNEKYFLNFFFHFLNLVSISYIFKKRMGLIADVFLKFWTTRDVVRYMSKKSLFRKHLDKLHRNWNTIQSWTTARLPHLLILVNVIQFEKVSLSYIQNLRTLCLLIDCC